MKKILSYFVAAVAFVSCSQENVIENLAENNETKGVVAVKQELNALNENAQTRSSFYYNNEERKMKFSWAMGDKISVYPIIEPASNSVQEPFYVRDTDGGLNASFATEGGVRAVANASTNYVAITPFIRKDIDYTDIPITYLGQKTSGFPKMGLYYQNTPESMASYVQSEKDATANIEEYDYAVSDLTQSSGGGDLLFDLKRICGVMRFFLKCPSANVFDSLIIVNKDVKFAVEGTVNLYDNTEHSYKFTPTIESHAMSLAFEIKYSEGPATKGLDMTETSSDYYNGGVGYIVAYMMCAPVDLSGAEFCDIYLCGHDKNDPSIRYYYKATTTGKPNIKANDLWQWRAVPDQDIPITFNPISVQKWEEGITFQNGGGKGTETW